MMYAINQIVWISEPHHPHYPNYVKILEVLPDGYRVQVQFVLDKDGPIITVKEDQLSDSVTL